MFRWNAALYFHYSLQLEKVRCGLILPSAEVNDTARKELEQVLGHFIGDAPPDGEAPASTEITAALNPLIVVSARHLLGAARSSNVSQEAIINLIVHFQKLMIEALLEPSFFAIPKHRRPLYSDKALFGSGVDSSFPDCTRDIGEAGKCIAMDRWTAAVFHLMRVLELGLRKLAGDLNVQIPPDELSRKPMGLILNECRTTLNKGMQSSQFGKNERDFYEEALAFLESAKNAWRNYVDHGRYNYSEEEAIEVFNAVRSFMRQIAGAP